MKKTILIITLTALIAIGVFAVNSPKTEMDSDKKIYITEKAPEKCDGTEIQARLHDNVGTSSRFRFNERKQYSYHSQNNNNVCSGMVPKMKMSQKSYKGKKN